MRPVNLLPDRFRRARATGERPGIGYAAVGVLAALLLMVLLYVLTNNSLKDAKQKTAEARAEQQQAVARASQLQGYGDFAALKTSREAAVRGIAQVRVDYERLMRETALLLPKDVYLTQFSAAPGADAATAASGTATAQGPQVTLAGCAPDHPAVATTLVRLRKLHNVADVELTSSTRGATGGGANGPTCRTSWSGTVSLEPESSITPPAQVPARLGGGQ